MLKFKIEQLALCPTDPEAAKQLLREMGAGEFAEDVVTASGFVYGEAGENVGQLAFDYELFKGNELEILHYTDGPNWMERHPNTVSHIGMHCTAEELVEWRKFFADRGIGVAQEVCTKSHTNPHIAGKRWYNYVIFDTREILSVDVKFIVRLEEPMV